MQSLNLSVLVFAPLLLAGAAAENPMPWEENGPIVDIQRALYQEHPAQGVGAWVSVRYVGPGVLREEIHTHMSTSDTPRKPLRRRSQDNGRTWSSFKPVPEIIRQVQGQRVYWGSSPEFFDAEHNVTVSIWLQQPHLEGRHHNHCFARTSHDLGLTWGEPKLLRYEPGHDFDPENPFDPDYLRHNQAYCGSNILRRSDGTLIHCVAHANAPGDPENDSRPWRMGSVCFLGAWDAGAGDYRWTPGGRVEIAPEVSARGLMEPYVAELKDGRLLFIWRGSNTAITAGRKWFSLSSDGGRTLTSPGELKYDDGSRFYSPSSLHAIFRHGVTGKLYWVGNICAQPPSGNSPRHPLVIAEVDESLPALKRATITRIDDRGDQDSPRLQLSNFSCFEDRETHAVELYLTRIGEDPEDFWGANAYKYTLTLKAPAPVENR
jgi:hypothetical protein